MITNADLSTQTRRELAELAKNYGVAGWHSMRKDDLITEVKKVQRRLRRKAAADLKKKGASEPSASTSRVRSLNAASSETSGESLQPTSGKSKSTKPASKTASRSSKSRRGRSRNDVPLPELTEPKVSAKTLQIRAEMRRRRELMQKHKDLSTSTLVAGSVVTGGIPKNRTAAPHRDRIVLLVRDSYWLQASWEITQGSVQRAQSAMAERWHTAVPTLRLFAVGDVASNRAETVSRDISIHGGVSTWYVDVQDPPSR